MAIRNGSGYVFSTTNNQSTIGIEKEFADMYDGAGGFTCSPFKVHDVVEVTEGETTYVKFEICPGTINNLMPQVYNTVTEEWEYLDDLTEGYILVAEFTTGESWVYLRSGKDASTGQFPQGAPSGGTSDPYPRVYTSGSDPANTDTDDFGYLALAKITEVGGGVYTIDQYVTGSLWADRIKLGSATAKYYYARI